MLRLPSQLQAWKPSAAEAWDLPRAAHLLRRAGFGGSRADAERLVELGMARAVDGLLTFDAEEDRAYREDLKFMLETADIEAVAGWWMYRMRNSRSPLREKLALFWHGHFATSHAKVKDVPAMARQLLLLIDHAAGSFTELTQAIVQDPAMLVWLDAQQSDALHPNENLARELFELFTLGRGAYTEQDVRESARALTGWRIHQGAARFEAKLHDARPKRLFGRVGNLGARDVVEATLEQPACAEFLARKLLGFFVVPQPEEAVVMALGAGLRENGMRVGWALDVLLRSRLFHAAETRRSLVKSPVELTLGLAQALGATGNFQKIAESCGRMGQNLLRPPSVRGWKGGMAWIDAASILQRHSLAERLMSGELGKRPAPPANPAQALMLDELPPRLRHLNTVQQLAALPEYQLN